MGTQVDVNQVGMPTPHAWEITNVEAPGPRGSSKLTKLTISTPNGLFTLFLSGDDAQLLGSQLRAKGKQAGVGLYTPGSEDAVGSNGIRDPFMPTGPTEASSGRTTDVSG